MLTKINRFLFGGDYNPDQWSRETIKEDIKWMKYYGVNVVTLPVFSWAKLQSEEDLFHFEWLDEVIDTLYEAEIYVNLATPTAAQPAWMSKKYPDILPVDKFGTKRKHGGRTNFCPNSQSYQKFIEKIAHEMAKRYSHHPGVIAWHINNEYGTYCYCENCRHAFIKWLQKRYDTLENLNEKWYTSFWGHTYYDWDEIEVPSALTEILPGRLGGRDGTNFQSIAIDYRRFMTDSIKACFDIEAKAVREVDSNIPVTTNIWGVADPLDLFTMTENQDFASWDCYPSNKDESYDVSFKHDVIRGLKQGQSFLLMEQTPNQQNWQDYNALKRPGVMRLLSYQSIAHGADGVLFFQLRQSKSACEKYHAALIPHAGHGETRIGRELKRLGDELNHLPEDLLGARIKSELAIVLDWNSWWGIEYSSGPSIALEYIPQLQKYYKALNELQVSVDIINPASDFGQYKVVIAPTWYMMQEDHVKRIKSYVAEGGTFITNFMSGIVDENDQVYLGGYPGAIGDLLGVWVEEVDALYPDMTNTIIEMGADGIKNYDCNLICEVIHLKTAKALAKFGKDYYAGSPCVTVNDYKKGKAYYIGTNPEDNFLKNLFKEICSLNNIKMLELPHGVERILRSGSEREYHFYLNHNNVEVTIPLDDEYKNLINKSAEIMNLVLGPKDVAILIK